MLFSFHNQIITCQKLQIGFTFRARFYIFFFSNQIKSQIPLPLIIDFLWLVCRPTVNTFIKMDTRNSYCFLKIHRGNYSFGQYNILCFWPSSKNLAKNTHKHKPFRISKSMLAVTFKKVLLYKSSVFYNGNPKQNIAYAIKSFRRNFWAR